VERPLCAPAPARPPRSRAQGEGTQVLRPTPRVLLVLLSAAGQYRRHWRHRRHRPRAPDPAEVILPLHDYLALSRSRAADASGRGDRPPRGRRCPRSSSSAAWSPSVRSGSGGEAEAGLTAHYEAWSRAIPKSRSSSPWSGPRRPRRRSIALAGAGGGAAAGAGDRPERGTRVLLMAPAPGACDRRPPADPCAGGAPSRGGGQRRPTSPGARPAPSPSTRRSRRGRRTVRLWSAAARPRSWDPAPVWMHPAGKLLAQSGLLTGSSSSGRTACGHGRVLYEVSRGSLASLHRPAARARRRAGWRPTRRNVVRWSPPPHGAPQAAASGDRLSLLTFDPRAGTALPVQAVAPAF